MQILINGLLLGGLYALVTIGFSLVWGVMNVVNMAHASFLMLGAYIALFLFQSLRIDPFAGIPVAMALLFVLGYLLQRLLINRIIRYGLIMTLIITFGIDLMIKNLGLELFTADFRSVAPTYAGAGFSVLGATVPYIRLAILAAALVLSVALALFLARTRIGMAIRATALHLEAAELVGVSVDQIYAVTFGLAAAIAGAGGVLISMIYNFNPYVGDGFVTPMFVITVLGGLGSLPGAIIGGLALGLIEAGTTVALSPGASRMIPFIILVLILVLRPQGLLGKRFYGGSKA